MRAGPGAAGNKDELTRAGFAYGGDGGVVRAHERVLVLIVRLVLQAEDHVLRVLVLPREAAPEVGEVCGGDALGFANDVGFAVNAAAAILVRVEDDAQAALRGLL